MARYLKQALIIEQAPKKRNPHRRRGNTRDSAEPSPPSATNQNSAPVPENKDNFQKNDLIQSFFAPTCEPSDTLTQV